MQVVATLLGMLLNDVSRAIFFTLKQCRVPLESPMTTCMHRSKLTVCIMRGKKAATCKNSVLSPSTLCVIPMSYLLRLILSRRTNSHTVRVCDVGGENLLMMEVQLHGSPPALPVTWVRSPQVLRD